jgi:PhoPQ-activated pathogenicity-related protein
MVTFFEQVLADFRQRYLVHYTPTGVSEKGWHTITVRLKKPAKYTVTARRGYFGG